MPKAVTTVTAKYAPPVTARVSGDAKGLRASDWNRAPATPKAMPTRIPAPTRGSRDPSRMSRALGPSSAGESVPVTALNSSLMPMPEVPCVMCHAEAMTRMATSPSRAAAVERAPTTPRPRTGTTVGSGVAVVGLGVIWRVRGEATDYFVRAST